VSAATVAGGGALRATVLDARDPEWNRCERELLDRGVHLPLSHRVAWTIAEPGLRPRFLALRAADGAYRYGFAFQIRRSRALPGHSLLRVEHLDPSVDPDACAEALRAFARVARRPWPRTLRAYVELFSLDADARARAGQCLRGLGFQRSEHPRMYTHTPIVDLAGDEEAVFARFHRSARRNVRAAMKGSVEVRPVTDPRLAGRVDALIRESFARTGGAYQAAPWKSIIELSAREPDLSRVAGFFRTDVNGPEALLAFEWACMHGDHGQSVAAGSTRAGGTRVPLAYPLIWEILRWARERGARYFDLGGITAGTYGSGDPLGGISDFKRFFGPRVVEVGEEWTLEPHRGAAWLAGAAHRVGRLLARR